MTRPEGATQEAASLDADIALQDVSKWFGPVEALHKVSLNLSGGGIWAIVGPNGAGKSTLFRLLSGQLQPNLGSVAVFRQAPYRNASLLASLGYCPDGDILYETLTPREFVRFAALMSGLGTKEAKEKTDVVLAKFDLLRWSDRKASGLSRGLRQRVKLAQAFVHDPKLLILDEPFAGTDPDSRAHILACIQDIAEGGATVLVSSHLLRQVEKLTERGILLSGGRVLSTGSFASLWSKLEDRPHRLHVSCDRPRDLASALIGDASIASVRVRSSRLLEAEVTSSGDAYGVLIQTLLHGNYEIDSFYSPDDSLESLYRSFEAQKKGAA